MQTFHNDFARLLAQLKRHEGANKDPDGYHIPYRCPAHRLTIGYGHNLDANPVPGINGKLTEDQAQRLLEADVIAVQEQLAAHLPWIKALNAPRYAMLVNMAFNLGVGGLLGFKKTLAFVRVGDFRSAAKEMLNSKWAAQVGNRAKELSRQMETGQWQG